MSRINNISNDQSNIGSSKQKHFPFMFWTRVNIVAVLFFNYYYGHNCFYDRNYFDIEYLNKMYMNLVLVVCAIHEIDALNYNQNFTTHSTKKKGGTTSNYLSKKCSVMVFEQPFLFWETFFILEFPFGDKVTL